MFGYTTNISLSITSPTCFVTFATGHDCVAFGGYWVLIMVL